MRCEQARGVWEHAPPGKFLKLGTLRWVLRPCLGQNAIRITPPVVFVAGEAIEPCCQKWPPRATRMLAPPQFARSPRAQVSLYISWKLRNLNSLVATLDAWKFEKVRRSLKHPKLRRTARRGHSITHAQVRIPATPFFLRQKPVRPWPYRPYLCRRLWERDWR